MLAFKTFQLRDFRETVYEQENAFRTMIKGNSTTLGNYDILRTFRRLRFRV